MHVEERYEDLVEKLKDKLYIVIYNNQEEASLEVEGTREEIEDEFALDGRDEYFEESEEEKEIEENVESNKITESEEMEESEKAKEHNESEEKYEHENEDLLWRLFDG